MDAVSVKVVPSTLCGTLTGQHSEQHLVQFLTKQLHLLSVSSSLILLSDLDGEGPISAGSQAHLQPCFWISKVESKGEDHLGYYLEETEGDDIGFVFYKKQLLMSDTKSKLNIYH